MVGLPTVVNIHFAPVESGKWKYLLLEWVVATIFSIDYLELNVLDPAQAIVLSGPWFHEEKNPHSDRR